MKHIFGTHFTFASGAVFLLLISTPIQNSWASQIPNAHLEAGDSAYKNRAQENDARAALSQYRAAFKENPQDSDAGWRLSMACYFVGLRLTANSDERKKLFSEGRDSARSAVESSNKNGKKCPECHFWLAINMALYGQEVGVFKMLFTLAEVREHLKKTIDSDPNYASAGAYRLLGVISQKLPGILGGSNSEARDFFSEAIRLAPDEPLNYLFLAHLLSDEFDDKKAALKIAKAGAEIENLPGERLESIEAKEELRVWYEKAKH